MMGNGRKTHGLCPRGTQPAEYKVWAGMKARCFNPNHSAYRDYGGRGVSVCERWTTGEAGLTGYECFIADMGARPGQNHTIERTNNDLGYCPDNCEWATRHVQARNRSNNHVVTVLGQTMILHDAIAKFAVVSKAAVRNRMKAGWTAEAALLTPRRPPYSGMAEPSFDKGAI